MRVFKDQLGREWTIDINLDARQVVQAKAGVDLLDSSAIEKLADLATLGAVLYVLCEEQVERLRLSERDFARALKGDAFDDAREALEGELIDFFPKGRRSILSAALAKAKHLEAMALAAAAKELNSGRLEAAMRKTLDETWNASSGGSRD